MSLTIRDTLLWYKRPDVREAMIAGAAKKEIGVRFNESFGKRPDALEYEQEVLQAVQRGATSFHASEELWSAPLAIETGMSKQRGEELRVGWDLVLDIDFTNFAATKIITQALCHELERHGVMHYGVKFSGNKGFHIGVAWESFPETFDGEPLAAQFPDLPRKMADYLVHTIDNPENGFALSERLREMLGQEESVLHAKRVCATCGRDRLEKTRTHYFVCSRCGHQETRPGDEDTYLVCEKCSSVMERVEHKIDVDSRCECGAKETREKFDLKIDTQLIASRHLYRIEYSLHEKSGLASVVIPHGGVMSFQREDANPQTVTTLLPFWNRSAEVTGQGYQLLVRALAFTPPEEENKALPKEVVWDLDAAPEETFPPCIKLILQGMKDGKKRSVFVLINFLQSIGWTKEMIEARLKEWNKVNPEPLREVVINGSLRYHTGKKVLPPSCDNKAYYVDFGVCKPDTLCARIKNPVQYVRLKMKQTGAKPPASQPVSSPE
jgi:hypothetical protein